MRYGAQAAPNGSLFETHLRKGDDVVDRVAPLPSKSADREPGIGDRFR